MDERVVSLRVVGEEAPERDSEDAEWELAWRRMRLFQDMCGYSWIVSCPCFASAALSTFFAFFFFLLKTCKFILAFDAIVSLFSVGFTLYACVSRRPLPCWRPRWRCVARFVALFVFVNQLVLLAMSAFDVW